MTRKIDVYIKLNKPTPYGQKWEYMFSTWNYKTCKAAVVHAKMQLPECTFKANFA
jgi:hypothetical protein